MRCSYLFIKKSYDISKALQSTHCNMILNFCPLFVKFSWSRQWCHRSGKTICRNVWYFAIIGLFKVIFLQWAALFTYSYSISSYQGNDLTTPDKLLFCFIVYQQVQLHAQMFLSLLAIVIVYCYTSVKCHLWLCR